MFNKKYIKLSISLYIASILIIKKFNSGLRIYIDYRALNTLIIKNRNASPLIYKTLIKLYIIKIYSKFNIIAIFNKIKIKKGDKEKTIFLIKYNFFEYVIMLFELYNISSIF